MITQDAVQGKSRLFYWKAGDPSLRCSLPQSLKYSQNEGIPQRLLHWSEGVADA